MKSIGLLCVSTLALALPQMALADDCTTNSAFKLITTAPYNITSAGNYCLANDITVSGKDAFALSAIGIVGGEINIDLNNKKLSFDTTGPNSAYSTGIQLFISDAKAYVYNGSIDGFHIGFQLNGNYSADRTTTGASSTADISNVKINSTKVNDGYVSTGIVARNLAYIEVAGGTIESSYDLYGNGDIVSNGTGLFAEYNTRTNIQGTQISAANGIWVSLGGSVTVTNAMLENNGNFDSENYGIRVGTMNSSTVDDVNITGFQSGIQYYGSKVNKYSHTDILVYGDCVVGRVKDDGTNTCAKL